jgi:hypothetical protein
MNILVKITTKIAQAGMNNSANLNPELSGKIFESMSYLLK